MLACLSMVVAQTSSSNFTTGLSVQDARIAFITSEGNLATINADGSDLRLLSDELVSYQFPAWSPEGARIAAIGNDGSQGLIDIFADESVDDSSNSSRMFASREELPFYMYWSPDAQMISFLANTPESGLAMNLVDVESKDSRARAFGSPFYWQWTADSTKVFMHQGIINGQVGFLEAAGDKQLAENLAESGFFRSPGISPSGDYIAYGESGIRGNEIIIKNSPLSTNDLPEVSRALSHKGFTAMSWSPEQDQLAFILPKQESMSSFGDLATMDAETGLLETLTEESVIAFFWSPDGKYIMYLTPQRAEGNDFANQLDVYRSARGDTIISESYLAQYLAQGDEIELAVNIAEVSIGEVTYLTSIRPTVNFINQFVPFFEQYALSHNVWSGDSQAVVLPTRDREGMSNIAVIYIEDGSLDIIAKGSTPFWQH